jgi:hypothetical protein
VKNAIIGSLDRRDDGPDRDREIRESDGEILVASAAIAVDRAHDPLPHEPADTDDERQAMNGKMITPIASAAAPTKAVRPPWKAARCMAAEPTPR